MTNTQGIKLEAQTRKEKNITAKKERRSGFIPANLYGKGVKNVNLKVKELDFKRVFSVAGESHLIELAIDKAAPVKVIVKDTQKDTTKDNVIHVDFYKVDMDKKITTEIPLKFIGESRAVKEKGGILVKSIDSVSVKCLPGDLVDNIEVSLANLNDFHDHIRISDIKLPAGIEVLADINEMVITVAEPAKEEVAAAVEPTPEAAAGEGEKTEEAAAAKTEEKK